MIRIRPIQLGLDRPLDALNTTYIPGWCFFFGLPIDRSSRQWFQLRIRSCCPRPGRLFNSFEGVQLEGFETSYRMHVIFLNRLVICVWTAVRQSVVLRVGWKQRIDQFINCRSLDSCRDRKEIYKKLFNFYIKNRKRGKPSTSWISTTKTESIWRIGKSYYSKEVIACREDGTLLFPFTLWTLVI